MLIYNKESETAQQSNDSRPTEQMRDFMDHVGIDPRKYGAMNAEAERVKIVLDQRIEDYQRKQENDQM